MTVIKIADIQALRKRTGAGMMDCKKALHAANGVFELAIDILRKKGLSKAIEKIDRNTSAGLIALRATGNNIGVILEIGLETDFISQSVILHKLIDDLLNAAINCQNLDNFSTYEVKPRVTVNDLIMDTIAALGENIKLSNISKLINENGVIVPYMHNLIAKDIGKIGVLVSVTSNADKDFLCTLGKKLAMHIAASNPVCLKIVDLDKDFIAKEKKIFADQIDKKNKSDEVINKIVNGKLQKLYENIVLLEQVSIFDNSIKINELLLNCSKEVDDSVEITDFIRYESNLTQ